jgi:zinc D-Ala-D-Ala carboxypeptidase
MKAQWGKQKELYPNFPKSEFDCKHTGLNEMRHDFMLKLQALRLDYGKPMAITSGYRHPTHPIEARKTHSNGEHTQGNCCDIACNNTADRFRLVKLALEHGFTRIGIAKTFIHLGMGGVGLPNNVIWEYQ